MNREIEELVFKDRKDLANLNEIDLLEIIEFLQLDRKQWINQYSKTHNDYVELNDNWNKLKEELETKINDIKEDDAYDRTEFQAGMLFAFEEMLNKMQELESRK